MMSWDRVEGRSLDHTVEHILPQSAGNAYWLERFSEKEQASLVHDLGNLCLTYDNSSYGNKSFLEKRGEIGWATPCYANSPLKQERALLTYFDWTPTTIESRRTAILEFLMKRWEFA